MTPILGRPGPKAPSTVFTGFVSRDGQIGFWPRGGILDGAKTRDPSNSANILALRPGLLLGKVFATGKLANSIICLTGTALAGAGTSLTLPVAGAAELYRRRGAASTFTLTGPPAAGGVARSVTVTYSAIDLGTGIVTMTALGAQNQIDHVRFNTSSTGGNLQLRVQKPDGTFVTTGNAAWNATDATYLTNINAALDAATGVAGGIVASAIPAIDTDNGFALAYSGTGYAGKPWTQATVAVLPTGATGPYYSTPVAAAGSFVTGSVVGDVDGSQLPTTVIPDGVGTLMASDSRDIELPRVPCSMIVDADRVIDYPADASLKAWVRASMDAAAGKGKFIFSDAFP